MTHGILVAPGQELLQRYEWRARGGHLHSRLEITSRGFVLGAETVLAKTGKDARGRPCLAPGSEARVKALLAAALGQPPEPYVLEKMRRAAELWNAGEKAVAHFHLAFARLPPLESDEQSLLLFLAEECLDCGVPPAEVTKRRGSRAALFALLKYNPDQPRVPAGSGRTSGQFAPAGGSAGGDGGAAASPAETALVAPAAAASISADPGTLAEGLFGPTGSKFLAALGELAATIGGAGAVLGAIFVPSPNPGLTSEGEVPDDSGLRYRINHDEGSLRLTNEDGEIVAAARLGQGGIFYDVKTGEPIARNVGGSVVFDEARLKSVAAPASSSDAAAQPASAARAAANENAPKLCPDPGPDAPHGAEEPAIKYQAQISALNIPQRPLSPGLAVSLINPLTGKPVYYDDCRESDGTMIEAKGPGYADKLDNAIVGRSIRVEWIGPATRQVQASQGRRIEWYFAEQEAADEARDIFDKNEDLRRIFVFTVPAEAP